MFSQNARSLTLLENKLVSSILCSSNISGKQQCGWFQKPVRRWSKTALWPLTRTGTSKVYFPASLPSSCYLTVSSTNVDLPLNIKTFILNGVIDKIQRPVGQLFISLISTITTKKNKKAWMLENNFYLNLFDNKTNAVSQFIYFR